MKHIPTTKRVSQQGLLTTGGCCQSRTDFLDNNSPRPLTSHQALFQAKLAVDQNVDHAFCNLVRFEDRAPFSQMERIKDS